MLRASFVLIIGLFLLATRTVPCRGDELSDLIEKITENERLYENIDWSWTREYRMIAPRQAVPDMTAEKTEHTRSVRQAEYCFLDVDGQERGIDKPFQTTDVRLGFDGQQTLMIDRNAIGNIVQGRREDGRMMHPHTMLLQHFFIHVPLSVYLRGDEAIAAHPNGSIIEERSHQVTWLRREQFREFDCDVVRVVAKEWITGGHLPSGHYDIWIARNRNYLPVKLLCYYYWSSRTMPEGEFVVENMEDAADGVWYPQRTRLNCNDQDVLKKDGLSILCWTQTDEVTAIDLNPRHDVEFFRDVTFPDGVAMYHVGADGKIEKSYQYVAPPSAWNWWIAGIVTLFVILMMILLLLLLARRRRSRRTLADATA